MIKHLIFIFFLLLSLTSNANKLGKERLDSLLAELPKHTIDDTNKVKTLCRIGIEYYSMDPPEGIRYANQVLNLSLKINYIQGIGNAYSILSCCYGAMGNHPLALEYGQKCLKINEETNDSDGIVKALGMIGSTYAAQKDYDKAIEYYKRALVIAQTTGESLQRTISNIASIYSSKGDLVKAQEYMEQDLEMSRKSKNKRDEANVLGNIASLHIKRGNFEDGLECLNKSLVLSKELGNKIFESYAYRGLSKLYLNIAIDSNVVALKKICNGDKDLSLRIALCYADTALEMAKTMGSLGNQAECYKAMYMANKSQGNFNKALENHENLTRLRDSIFNKEKSSKITQLSMQFEFDKKEAAEKAKHEKEVTLARAEVQKQRVIRNSSIAGTMAVLLFVSFSFYNYQRRRQLEKMQALATERLRISRELHDDVGSALGSIALYSDVAVTRSLKKESTSDVLLKIGNASRELVEKMSDIIWSMNPDNENTDKLVSRMKGFASSLLTPLKANVHYEFDPSLNKLFLSGDRMKNIFLIYKEAIYNIAKYAECRNVDIVLSTDGSMMFLSIKDDGKGFETAVAKDAYNGNGLNNMNARTILLNGTINIQSAPGAGTRIELTAPVTG